ncbi:MAG: class I SAM-dependent methyltransferase [Sulfuricurvum sp.]
MEITNKAFWENYWGTISVPQTVDYSFKNDRIIAETIKKHVPHAILGQNAAEIGCAPGKWLVFLNKELGYKVYGYEYLEPAAQKTKENLLANNIDESMFTIKVEDFVQNDLKDKFNLVLSLGFIEHFDNYPEILQKHYLITEKGGYIVVGIPNYRGITYLIQQFIDNFGDSDIIKNHNLNVMNLSTFKTFGATHELKNIFLGYIGGFERGLFTTNGIKNPIVRILIKIATRILSLILGRFNHPKCSGYILAIYTKEI